MDIWEFNLEIKEALQEKLEKTAAGYLPMWKFSRENPDAASVIALIFSEQMEGVVKRWQELPKKAGELLAELTGIQAAGAKAARMIFVPQIEEEASQGVELEKGTSFLVLADNREEPLYFQSLSHIRGVSAGLCEILYVSERQKAVCCCELWKKGRAFSLFAREGKNLYEEEIRAEHPLLPEGEIGFCDFGKDSGRLWCTGAKIRAGGAYIRPGFIFDGTRELDTDCFAAFGEEMQPYKECYIGQDEVFAHQGALVVLAFDMEWTRWGRQKPAVIEEEELPLVRRRKRRSYEDPPVAVEAQEVSLTYFNGKGFRNLPLEQDISRLFEGREGRKKCTIAFTCPSDWKPFQAGGSEARCLRLCLVRAEGCYLPQAIHYAPVIKGLKLSYSYPEEGVPPQRLLGVSGGTQRELTKEIKKTGYAPLFQPFPFQGEEMLFGFDRIFPEGRISLFFLLRQLSKDEKGGLVYSYSTKRGFRPLKVEDHTEGLVKSGLLLLTMPGDGDMLEVEGRKCFWIKAHSLKGEEAGGPKVEKIFLNGVEAENTCLKEPKEYYLEEARPFLETRLNCSQLLDAQVWVNEMEKLSPAQKQSLMETVPDKVWAGYDVKGRMTEFFVLWEETYDFDSVPGDGRCYVLDRYRKLLRFGDGRKAKIPGNVQGVSYKVRLRSCDGAAANVEAGSPAQMTFGSLLISHVLNPDGGAGGSDIETGEGRRKRAGTLLYTGNRLVCEEDYARMAADYSGQIALTSCRKGDGGETIVYVLMKDFEKGMGSFYQIREDLERYLRSHGSITEGSRMRVEAPVPVKISVLVWVEAKGEGWGETEQSLLAQISHFIDTFRNEQGIGRLPEAADLDMMLHCTKGLLGIQGFCGIAAYTDEKGEHEVELEKVNNMPFGVCINGKHQVLRRECT